MLAIQHIKNEEENLTREINAIAKNLHLPYANPIYDGVCDLEQYLSCGKRIMWIMKEAWDSSWEENGIEYIGGGGWSMVGCFSGYGVDGKLPKDNTWKQNSLQSIIYAMYGYFNNKKFQDMDMIKSNKSMANILQQIAYINISKMPGRKNSNDKDILQSYRTWKNILFKQIDLYNPEIIICANTFKYFQKDLEINDLIDENEVLNTYTKDGRLWLDAYHPNQRKVSREWYVNSILKTIRVFYDKADNP